MEQVNSFTYPSIEQKAHELALEFMKENKNANFNEDTFFSTYYRIYENYKSSLNEKLGF